MSAAARIRARLASRIAWSGANGSISGVRSPRHQAWVIAYVASSASTISEASSSVWPGVSQSCGCGRESVAVTVVVEPLVADVAGPEVDDLGLREEGDVDRVVGMVVRQEHVADRLGRDPEGGERVEDQRPPGDHPGIDHDPGVAVEDQDDAAGDPIAGIAGVEQVDGGHRLMISPRTRGPRTGAGWHEHRPAAMTSISGDRRRLISERS